MKAPTKYRRLDSAEQKLADSVYRGTLGSFQDIYLSDGLGQDNTPFTLRSVHALPAIFGGMPLIIAPGKYVMFVGSYCDTSMTSGYAASLLIHELAHVWQYAKGYSVVLNSLVHRALKGEGMYDYDTTNYKKWNEYNVEQQASIVEDWFKEGMKTNDPRYRYIGENIWDGLIPYEFDSTRPDPPRPSRITTTDPLADLMKPRYAAGDPASLQRVRDLETLMRGTANPRKLLDRLQARRPDDQAVTAFYHVLAPVTTQRLLAILRTRA